MLTRFERCLQRPRASQETRLRELVNRNANTEFGVAHNFAGIESFEQFQTRVPARSWVEFEPWVARAKRSTKPVLTEEPPLFFERISGSSSACKHVPYTRRLLEEFQRALLVWLARLRHDCPRVAKGHFANLWPSLAVVSCWMDGPSEPLAKELMPLFPGSVFTPKGLLATEGVVSLPWGLSGLNPLAVHSHVLEFVDYYGVAHTVDTIQDGECYRPLLTTGGGPYSQESGRGVAARLGSSRRAGR